MVSGIVGSYVLNMHVLHTPRISYDDALYLLIKRKMVNVEPFTI